MHPHHYDVLGVSPEASEEDIRVAYASKIKALRKAMLDGQAASPENLDVLRDAYRVLSSPPLRAEYDRDRQRSMKRHTKSRPVAASSGPSGTPPKQGKWWHSSRGRLIVVGLSLGFIAGLGYGGWYAWDTGSIPGNPRAATVDAMLPAVGRVAALKLQQQWSACVGPEFERAAPEIQGPPGMANRLLPGQHLVVLLLETDVRHQDARERQLRQLGYFAKQGFFVESETTVGTDAGPRPAKQYQLTWQGFEAMQARGTGTPCFFVGSREFNGIRQIDRHPETVLGLPVFEVTYETAVTRVPSWASGDAARELFPKLTELLQPKREKALLLRGPNGWVTEAEAKIRTALLQESKEGTASRLQQLEQLTRIEEQMTVAPAPTASEAASAFDEYLKSEQWLRQGTVACLPLRLQRGGDDREAAADRTNYRVTYYDQGGRPEHQRKQMLTALHFLSALEAAGLATLDNPPPPSPAPSAAPGTPARSGIAQTSSKKPPVVLPTKGARFTLAADVVHALGLNSNACIPVGRMKVEYLGMQHLAGRSSNVIAYGKVGQAPAWVAKIVEHLPAARSAIDNGIPFTGTLKYVDDTRSTEKGKRWTLNSLSPAYPEMSASNVPAALEDRFPVTMGESRKLVSSGAVGLPQPTVSETSPAEVPGITAARIPAPAVRPQPVRGDVAADKTSLNSSPEVPYVADENDAHVISVYEGKLPGGQPRGFQEHPEGVTEVRVGKTGKPVMLLLSSYEPNEWRITLEPGAHLGKVVAYGNYQQRVTVNGKHQADVDTPSAESMLRGGKVKGNAITLPTSIDPNQMRDVAEVVRSLTGKEPTSFQAHYQAKQSIVVDASTAAFSLPAPTSVASLGATDVVLKGASRDPITALEVSYGNVGAYTPAWASRAYSSGRVYFEGYMTVTGALVSEPHANVGVALARSGGLIDDSSNKYAVIAHGQQRLHQNGDVFGLALDLDAGMAYVRINGDWVTGEPGSGNGRKLKQGREYVPYFWASAVSSGEKRLGQTSWTANFGANAFRHSLPNGYTSYDGRQR